MQPYVVISADSHAGLPTELYRDYLETIHHRAFDEFLAERAGIVGEIRRMGTSSEQFAKQWFSENAEGLEGGWDAGRRNKELDADGVSAEVIFPDADAVESRTCAPFGAGLGLSGDLDPVARAGRRPGAQPVAGRTVRRLAGSAAAAWRCVPITAPWTTCSRRSGGRTIGSAGA